MGESVLPREVEVLLTPGADGHIEFSLVDWRWDEKIDCESFEDVFSMGDVERHLSEYRGSLLEHNVI